MVGSEVGSPNDSESSLLTMMTTSEKAIHRAAQQTVFSEVHREGCTRLRWLASCHCGQSRKRGDDRMSIFPTKILLATDGSEDSELAATTAVGLAKATGSELNVVTVAEEYPHYQAYRPLAKRSRQLAQEVLDEQPKKIENLGSTVDQTYLRMGRAAEEVVS